MAIRPDNIAPTLIGGIVRCYVQAVSDTDVLRTGFDSTGTLLVDCGKNVFCCGAVEESCCDDESNTYFVDPETGEVKDPSKASATQSPTWWTVDSKALLAATSSSSVSSSTDSATELPSSSITAPPSSTPTNTSTSEQSDSKGLSAGAGAGIGIGAAAGVALVVGLGWWLLKRRKQQNEMQAPAYEHVAGAYGNEVKHGNYYAHQAGAPPAGQGRVAEPQELDGMSQRQELQATSPTGRV
ncbi:hypothetical protein N0V90_006093 [Kalmusia sp. IMI 367209]|nr:hypothetical protein N0V90_006093 [Kalmusia sp. IMI 367209]